MGISRRTFHQLMIAGAGRLVLAHRPAHLFAQASMQPFSAAVERLVVAMDSIGSPLSTADKAALHAAYKSPGQGSAAIEPVLDPHVLLEARINPEGRISVSRGAAKAELVEHGWRTFLIKVNNEAAVSSSFKIYSPQGEPVGRASDESIIGVHDFTNGAIDAVEASERWIEIDNWSKPPLLSTLSGLAVEYRILLLYSRDRGQREASLEAMLGDEEQDLGFRSSLPILFACLPSQQLSLRILDMDGSLTTASLLITDSLERIYPAQNKRALPDLWFERHIYRNSGESVTLPPGEYTLEYGRGPEYLARSISLLITQEPAPVVTLQLERWIAPSKFGYYSGDTHIHAAGCSHYESPSEGVTPDVMYRQVRGEALDLGDVLTWGPGYYYQKQFFSGHVEHDLAGQYDDQTTLRYDVEVSGFPSSHCGHLVLLQLTKQNYPGTTSLDQWPSWNGPVLTWAKKQGALAGYAHSGHGLNVDSTALPNYLMPPFDSMGANEYIADVTHEGLLDFISGCDTRPFAELNIWYHTLNCGFRTVFVGETDFPCLSDERVGGGRTYVEMRARPTGDPGYAEWIKGVSAGRSYAGDGRSHIFRFELAAGTEKAAGKELLLDGPAKVTVTAIVCAMLEAEVSAKAERIHRTSPYDKPYWHLERARIGKSRQVSLELIINGEPVRQINLIADGSPHDITFEVQVDRSSWLALRILPSSHTNPLIVLVGNAPVRASQRSAQWCRAAVDVCWVQKSRRIRTSELTAARAAFDHARTTYDRIISECRGNQPQA